MRFVPVSVQSATAYTAARDAALKAYSKTIHPIPNKPSNTSNSHLYSLPHNHNLGTLADPLYCRDLASRRQLLLLPVWFLLRIVSRLVTRVGFFLLGFSFFGRRVVYAHCKPRPRRATRWFFFLTASIE